MYMQKIVRLYSDYGPVRQGRYTSDKLSKHTLLLEVSPPGKDDIVLVSVLGDLRSLPSCVPRDLIYRAGRGGLYRAKDRWECKNGASVEVGHLVEVLDAEFSKYLRVSPYLIPRRNRSCRLITSPVEQLADFFMPYRYWQVKLLDGSGRITCCDPAVLVPIDGHEPPNYRALDEEKDVLPSYSLL